MRWSRFDSLCRESCCIPMILHRSLRNQSTNWTMVPKNTPKKVLTSFTSQEGGHTLACSDLQPLRSARKPSSSLSRHVPIRGVLPQDMNWSPNSWLVALGILNNIIYLLIWYLSDLHQVLYILPCVRNTLRYVTCNLGTNAPAWCSLCISGQRALTRPATSAWLCGDNQ